MSGEGDLREQVEDLKRRLREVEEKKRVAEEEKEEMRRGREEVRGAEDVLRGSGAGGLASRSIGSAMHVGQQGMDNDDRQFYFPSGHLNTRPPKFRTDPAKVPLNSHGLGYTVKQSINPVKI